MKGLVLKKLENKNIIKKEFVDDIEILFEELANSYGGYDYFGKERFEQAKEAVLRQVEEDFSYEKAVEKLTEELSKFVVDGHFRVGIRRLKEVSGSSKLTPKKYDYAVKEYEVNGIPVIDIKKFYYDNEEEKQQLKELVENAGKYKKCEKLLIDLRDNGGGSDYYIYDFITNLFGEEPDYPMTFEQHNSDTFLEWLKQEGYADETETIGVEREETKGHSIASDKKIVVLINQNVASSGESAIAYLKTIENVTFMGENSCGAFFAGNCITIYLPNSGLPVYYGTGCVLYEGKYNIDETGFAPDVYGAFEVEEVCQRMRE